MSASPKPAGWAAKMRLKCDVEASRIGRIFAVTSLNFIESTNFRSLIIKSIITLFYS